MSWYVVFPLQPDFTNISVTQILHIEAIPNRTEDDEDSLRLLRNCSKTQRKDQQGTVLNGLQGNGQLLHIQPLIIPCTRSAEVH